MENVTPDPCRRDISILQQRCLRNEAALLFCFGVVSVAKLSEKQKRFVQEYLVDLNATAAARRAGYSAKTAEVIGYENLRKPQIAAEIKKQQVKQQAKLEITQERVLQELAAIAFANGTDFVTVTATGLLDVKPTSKIPKEKLPAIAGIKYNQLGVEVKLHDKVKALELLGKHLGVFDERRSAAEAAENNIFDVIDQSTREELDTSEISEIEPPTKLGNDVVE